MTAWSFYKDREHEWRWNRREANGEIVAAATQGYKNWAECLDNARLSGYVGPVVAGDAIDQTVADPAEGGD